jgi:cyanate permease
MVVASGLGPMPFGILFEMTESYDAAILGFVALPVICGFAAMAAVPPAKRAQVS